MAVEKKRFSMAAANLGTRAPCGAHAPPSKAPRASQLVAVEQGRIPPPPTRLPNNAPVQVCVYKVCDAVGDCWPEYEGTDAPLYQVQMKHDARPSVVFDLVRTFGDFLKTMHGSDESVPDTVHGLQQCGIKLILTDTQDPDGVGFVQWRPAFYVVGGPAAKPLGNFLLLLDEWWAYKAEALGCTLDVHYSPHTSVGSLEDIMSQLTHDLYSVACPLQRVPLGIFEAQPVSSKRIVMLNIQPESGDTVSILVHGNIWAYRNRFDMLGIPGNFKHE